MKADGNKNEKLKKTNSEKKILKKIKEIRIPNKPKMNKHININIFKVNDIFKFIPFVINIVLPLLLGGGVGYLNRDIKGVYGQLQKPFFCPPDIAFQIIWSILYILMGIAAYRIYMKNKLGGKDNGAYFYYLVQLMVNLLWPFVFFTFRLYGVSFVLILVLLILVMISTIKFLKVDNMAGLLMIPYIIWIVFASILNFFIYMLNEM